MMPVRIFKPVPDEGFEMCLPIDMADHDTIKFGVRGDRRGPSWRPIAMEIIKEDETGALAYADSPWFRSDALVFRPPVIEAMEPLLSKSGELLPLICQEAQLVLFNPIRLDSALDEAASSLQRFPADGTIMMIDHHVFRPEVVAGADAFKIGNMRVSSTYLSEAFVARWMNAGLRGVVFKEVWPNPEKRSRR